MNIKDSIYWDIFGEAWAFFKRHAEARKIDWDLATDEALAIGRVYENTPQFPLVKSLLLVTMDELERIGDEKNNA